MAADVHLPEAVLRLDVALGHEQVRVAVGVDLRDAVVVALDLDLTGQARELDGAGGLWEGRTHGAHSPVRAVGDTRDERQHQDEHEQPQAAPLFLLVLLTVVAAEGAVVVAGIAVLRGAGWSRSAGSNHRRSR